MQDTTGLHQPGCVEWSHLDSPDTSFGQAPSNKAEILIFNLYMIFLHVVVFQLSNTRVRTFLEYLLSIDMQALIYSSNNLYSVRFQIILSGCLSLVTTAFTNVEIYRLD